MKLRPDVPIAYRLITEATREEYLKILKSANCARLWLCCFEGNYNLSNDKFFDLEAIRKNIAFFEEHSIEVGIWINGYGFGQPIEKKGREKAWTVLKSVSGTVRENCDAYCPEDEDFMDYYLDRVRFLAFAGARLIMLDDDTCLSVRPGLGCFCDKHIALLEKELGERVDIKNLPELIFTGEGSRYRDAFLKVMGDTNRRFCRRVREAVDEVDPDIRVGICAGYTSWDVEGADALELSRILAGKNKPFFRFMGAPYWVLPTMNRFMGQRLASVIEIARNQYSWVKDSDAEFFAEADSYPRARYICNAAFIEDFDIAMRAEGIRSLKYICDYVSDSSYETGYLRLHRRNMPLYDFIDRVFEGKRSVGVRLFRPMHTLCDVTLPDSFYTDKDVMRGVFSQAAAMLSAITVPVCYDGESQCACLFGDDVRYFDADGGTKRIILDIPAALKLQKKGLELGIIDAVKTADRGVENFFGQRVRYEGAGKNAAFSGTGALYEVKLSDKCRVCSYFEGEREIPASYRIDCGGREYLVLCFEGRCSHESSALFSSYCRQEQIMDFVGCRYPYMKKQPEMYTLVKESADGLLQAVLFENLSRDPAMDVEISLPKRARRVESFGAEASLSADGRTLTLDRDIEPSRALALEIEYEE